MNVRSVVSSRLALQRFFARTDFVPSKTSISRRSRPGPAGLFKDSRPDTLAFMLSTLSTSQKYLKFEFHRPPVRRSSSLDKIGGPATDGTLRKAVFEPACFCGSIAKSMGGI